MKCPGVLRYRRDLVGLCLLLTVTLSACSKTKSADQTANSPEVAVPVPTAPAEEEPPNLALHLKVGERFPLQKTVITTLVQPGPNGPERSMAQKEFLLTITVEAMPTTGERAGQKQMGVRFQSVRFSRELNGKKLEYDSRKARPPIPLAMQPYHGLVGNSFSFWLGQDNQIEGIVDFDKFVERCLRGIPRERFEEVWNNLATQTGADGIANFVDDSIGLLPKSKVAVGESWQVTRRTQQPVPMVCKNRYTLQQLDEQQAEVSILGQILPGAILPNAMPSVARSKLHMSILGGKATGSCTIDLRTGLPIHSQVEQYVDMQVVLKNGDEEQEEPAEQFVQHKQTITTIRAFPPMSPGDDEAVTPKRVAQPLPRPNRG